MWQSIAAADEKDDPAPKHRIDVTAIFLDTLSVDTLNAAIGYTYSLTSNSNINITISHLDPDTGSSGNSGFSDTVVSYSFIPTVEIGANPWMPRTAGTGLAVLAPTGNSAAGRSLDSWVVSPYLGLVIPLSDRLFFAPRLGYLHSLDNTVAGTKLRLAYGDLGLGFVAKNGFWTSYFPQFVRDLETDDSAINHRVAVGKMFSRTFGLSLDYILVERFTFGSNLPGPDGFDEQFEVNVHFVF